MHEDLTGTNSGRILNSLHDSGVKMFAPVSLIAQLPHTAELTHSFRHEYSAPSLTVTVVEDVRAAIEHINQHGIFFPFLYCAD